MIVEELSRTFLTLRYTVRRNTPSTDLGGGQIPSWADLGDVDGSELVPVMARETYFTHRLEVRRQGFVVVSDTLGILGSDRILDSAGQEWEILGVGTYGGLIQLRLVEARPT
jgi:hypothetical protein